MLVGRTPAPEDDEDARTASLTDPRALRQAILERAARGGRRRHAGHRRGGVPPADRARARCARTSARLRGSGARVEYLACDVRDARSVRRADRRRLRRATAASTASSTAPASSRTSSSATRSSARSSACWPRRPAPRGRSPRSCAPRRSRFLVFFGSVSGRFGNRGQADYAAASEILNKLAHELDRRWPARVVSIDWGPWLTTGMVSPALQEEFERRGVVLIPIDEGCRLFEQELRNGRKGEAEVVIGGATGLAGATLGAARPHEPRSCRCSRRASVSSSDGAIEVVRTLRPRATTCTSATTASTAAPCSRSRARWSSWRRRPPPPIRRSSSPGCATSAC